MGLCVETNHHQEVLTTVSIERATNGGIWKSICHPSLFWRRLLSLGLKALPVARQLGLLLDASPLAHPSIFVAAPKECQAQLCQSRTMIVRDVSLH
jgi:hypothetical protein